MPTIPDPPADPDNDDSDLYVDPPPPRSFSEAVREAPLTAIATAFVAGLLVSRLVF